MSLNFILNWPQGAIGHKVFEVMQGLMLELLRDPYCNTEHVGNRGILVYKGSSRFLSINRSTATPPLASTNEMNMSQH